MTGRSLSSSSSSTLSSKSITSLLRLLALAYSLVVLQAPPAVAQEVLDFGILPACAGTCPSLVDAQASCVPPAAPVTDQETYESCFCQNAFLEPLFTSPNGVCDAFCAQPELDRIWQWFTGLCQDGVEPIDNENADVDEDAEGPEEPPPVRSDPVQSTPTPVEVDDDDEESGSWVSNNWEWIVFLVFLVLGITFFSILGVWLKRRYRRKRDLAGANLAAPEAVAPEAREIHTSQSATTPRVLAAAAAAGSSRTRTRKRTLSLGTRPNMAGPGVAPSMTSRDSAIIMPDVSSQLHLPVPAPSKGAWSVSSRPNSRPPSRVWTPDGSVGGAGTVRSHSRAGSSSNILERIGNAGEGEMSTAGRRSSTPSGAAALAESNVITENADERPSSAGAVGKGYSNGNGKAKERVDGAANAGTMRHGGSKLRE